MQAGVCKNATLLCTPHGDPNHPTTHRVQYTDKPPAQRPPAYIVVHHERQAVRAGTVPPTTTGRLRVVAMARATK